MITPESSNQKDRVKHHAISSEGDGEIFFFGLLQTLQRYQKFIATGALAGAIVALVYLWLSPNRYEAIAKIHMAQVSSDINLAIQGVKSTKLVNVEDPAVTIARFSSPSSYPPDVMQICDSEDSLRNFSDHIKLAIPKGVPNSIELKVIANSQGAAKECAARIFELVKSTQASIIRPYIKRIESDLKTDEQSLLLNYKLLERADLSGGAMMGAVYLSTKDHVNYLRNKVAGQREALSDAETHPTYLIAPVYVSDRPVSPKKAATLFGSVLFGCFFGCLLGLISIAYARLRFKKSVINS